MADKKKGPKLREGLEVDQLEICVPKKCRLHFSETVPANAGPDKLKAAWDRYLKPFDCKPGEVEFPKKDKCWVKLKGQCAVRHAVVVHEKIQRQVLRLRGVAATDVGFAILEHLKKFEKVLAIRIHATKKLTRWQLLKAGIPDLTSQWYANELPRGQRAEQERTQLSAALRAELGDVAEALAVEFLWSEYEHYPVEGITRADLEYVDGTGQPSTAEARSASPRLQVCGIPIDVVQARYFPAVFEFEVNNGGAVFVDALQTSGELSDEEQILTGRCRVNPLVGGISVGSVTGQAGTLGTIVWDRTDGTPCLLSNWHVLAGSAAAKIGQPCYQPAHFDGGTEADTVAHLKRWHLGELGDAAIAELSNARQYASGEIMGMWHPLAGYQAPELSLEVLKWGRTTGVTQGFIDGIHLATNIDYGNGMVRFFKDQFHIAPLYSGCDVSQVGDSGSLVLTCRKLVPLTKAEQLEAAEPEQKDEDHHTKEPVPDPNVIEALKQLGLDVDGLKAAAELTKRRAKRRAYLAVGMIFAGDTPGSPFGEFALASPLSPLADELQFSLRPVFEPRSSFRKVRSGSAGGGSDRPQGSRSTRAPGAQRSDPRGKGPQPDPEEAQSGSGGG